jgi:16S rRNA (adenine1518-N6/adenine1519-N6)-dimethyltransferase
MPLYRPSELMAWLQEHNISPKKSLSQNFLIDGNIVKKIVKCLQPIDWDIIIEIGPGPGVLTEELINHITPIFAIETDSQLADLLKRFSTVNVIEKDVFDLDWSSFFNAHLISPQKAAIVSNLPYHLSSSLLFDLLPLGKWVGCLVLMVQKEFADRLRSTKKDPDYGPLAIIREHYGIVTDHFDVPNQSFFPKPSVRSTVLKIELRNIEEDPQRLFAKFIRLIFSHRRKSLGRLMNLHSLQIDAKWHPFRAEQLSYSQLLEAFNSSSFAK